MSADGVSLGSGGKRLRTIDCVAQSLAVGPIYSAAALGGALAALAGGVGPLVILLTFFGVLGVGWTITVYARRYSGSGTVYEFIAHGMGKKLAVWSAGAYHFAALVLGGPATALIIGITAHGFFVEHLSLDLSWWIWSLIAEALVFGVNLIGIRVSVRAQLTIIGVSLVPFVILIVAIIADGGVAGNTLSVFDPGHVAEGGSIFKGLLFAILMFVGFELAAALGEETEHPRKSIPRAVISTIVIVAIFYVATQYVGAIGSGGPQELPFDFSALGTAYVGKGLGILIEVAILLDMLAVAIGFQAASARGLFTLARDRLLPRRLAEISSRDVPAAALTLVAAVTVIGVLLTVAVYGVGPQLEGTAVVFPEKAFNAFLIGSTIGGMLISAVYLVLCLGAVPMALRDRSALGMLAALVGIATAGGGVAAQFIPGTAPTGDAVWGRTFGLIMVGLLAVWLLYNMWRRPDVVDAVGGHALVHEEVAPSSVAVPQLVTEPGRETV